MDPDSDRMISDHVLRMHRYRAAGEQDGDGIIVIVLAIYLGLILFYGPNQ